MLIEMDDMNANHEITKFIKSHRTGTINPGKTLITVHLLWVYIDCKALLDIPKYTKYKKSDEIILKLHTSNPREIREINIPVKNDEELRSVNDQLRKIPNPWEHKAGNSGCVIKLQKVKATPCMYMGYI